MGSYKARVAFCSLLLLLSACSKKNVAGLYSYQKGAPNTLYLFSKQLELQKDSTFTYREIIHQDPAPDEGAPYYFYLGKGTYTNGKKQVTLNFQPKFRRVENLEVTPLSFDNIAGMRSRSNNLRSDSVVFIVFEIYIHNLFPLPAKTPIGVIKVNGQSIYHCGNNLLTFNTARFPLVLNINFENFSINSFDSHRMQLPAHGDFLNFNFGFRDEEVRIDKPGCYKVTIYPWGKSDLAKPDLVINGTWVLPIKGLFTSNKIGEMEKVDLLPQNDPY